MHFAREKNSKEFEAYQKYFYESAFIGKIVAIDGGRGLKIKIDTYDKYIFIPPRKMIDTPAGYIANKSQREYEMYDPEHLGDSLIKHAFNDTLTIKSPKNKIFKWEIDTDP